MTHSHYLQPAHNKAQLLRRLLYILSWTCLLLQAHPAYAQNDALTADFNFNINGFTVNFTDTSTDSDNNITSWNWNFGDGNTSTQQNPTHTYATVDNYTVQLTIQDNQDSTASTSKTFLVFPPPTNVAANFMELEEQVTLTWNAVNGATSYDIYRSLELPADLLLESNVTGTSFVDDKIGSTRELYYRIKARRGNQESGFSSHAVVNMQISNTAPFSVVGSNVDTLFVLNDGDALVSPVLELNLNNLFEDEDGDALTYAFTLPIVSDLVLSGTIMDGILRVVFDTRTGNIDFSILASDGRNGFSELDFKIAIDAPPRIFFEGSEPSLDRVPQKEDSVRVSAQVQDNNLARVLIRFRRGGDGSFFTDDMILAGNDLYTYTIPAFAMGERGIEYVLQAVDENDLQTTVPPDPFDQFLPDLGDNLPRTAFSIEVQVPEDGVLQETPQPAASANTNAYRLFSLPIKVSDPSPNAVLEDDLGSYAPSRWRFFEPVQNVTPALLPEFPNTANLLPGKAFWLILKDANKLIDSGAGESLPLDEPFTIELEPGWNFFGNPYSFDVPLTNVLSHEGLLPDIRYFNGAGWQQVLANDVLAPFEGYAVSNNTNSPQSLFIFPSAALKDVALFTGFLGSGKTDTQRGAAVWSMDIVAEAGAYQDTNRLSFYEGSNAEWDRLDKPEPPFIGDHVSLYFPHESWEQPIKRYSADVRPPTEEGTTWTFSVISTVEEAVTLTFESDGVLPAGFQALLIDEQLDTFTTLSEGDSYMTSSTTTVTQNFRLAVGPPSYLAQIEENATVIATEYALAPSFPNPFSLTTTIPYALAEPADVTLEVYSILGERVATLLSSAAQPAGRHSVVWNGSNDAGRSVANGLYFIQITAADYTDTQKVIVVR